MKLEDFEIGQVFFAHAGFQWLCTDKGKRTVNAIMLEPDKDNVWFKGPPYNSDEKVFDEYDILSCYTSIDDKIIGSMKKSYHPNFTSKDTFKIIRAKNNNYHRKNILKRDRVSLEGFIFHPYAATREEDGWYINVFELFSRTYSKIHEDLFVGLAYSSEEAMKHRAEQIKK